MDTMTLPQARHALPHMDECPIWPFVGDSRSWQPPPPAVDPEWHRLTHSAVVMAWTRDPDVMCDLVATLMDIHLRRSSASLEVTLDELHLMISMELQQLSGEPD